jgi:predicted adenylyl cyclase CyaB
VWYERADASDARPSDYRLVPVGDPPGLKAALAAALGVKTVVRKRRELLLHHNVRIHLDEVESLGAFIELEAVLGPDADEPLSRSRLAALLAALQISAADLVPNSYSDLIGRRIVESADGR